MLDSLRTLSFSEVQGIQAGPLRGEVWCESRRKVVSASSMATLDLHFTLLQHRRRRETVAVRRRPGPPGLHVGCVGYAISYEYMCVSPYSFALHRTLSQTNHVHRCHLLVTAPGVPRGPHVGQATGSALVRDVMKYVSLTYPRHKPTQHVPCNDTPMPARCAPAWH